MRNLLLAASAAAMLCAPGARAAESFALPQALAYPFTLELVSAPNADRIAWVREVRGVRNVWVADGPGFQPRQVTQFTADDGQELTQLTFSPDGKVLVFVRGGDHDANWPAEGKLAPDPTSSPTEAKVTLWSADPAGTKPAAKIVEGDAPAISSSGALAYLKDGAVWSARLDGAAAKKLFFDRGKDSQLAWSPDGTKLAFTSNREDHAFIGIFTREDQPLAWMAPSTGIDDAPSGRRTACASPTPAGRAGAARRSRS